MVLEASAFSSLRTSDRRKTRTSLERSTEKRYGVGRRWLLRYASSTRGIVRMTRVKGVDVPAASLEDGDKLQERSSPYMEDLYDSSPGEGELFATKC